MTDKGGSGKGIVKKGGKQPSKTQPAPTAHQRPPNPPANSGQGGKKS